MEIVHKIIVFIHILAGSTMIAFVAISQLIIGPALKHLSPGKEKSLVQETLKKMRMPIVDTAILLQIITAIYFLYFRWPMIANSHLMHMKVFFGVITLALAFLLHFYYRFKKKKASQSQDQILIAKLNKKTGIMEKVVLAAGTVTFISGIVFNHF